MIRHAYMIMAHHRPDLLQRLIDAIDDERNDIIIHIDNKSTMDSEQFQCQKAGLFFTDRISVNWGGYTQVACEYMLIRKALEIGHHEYYHFLTGVNYPLWNQDVIHDFFQEHQGCEFLGFDHSADFSSRAKYYIPFSEHGKLTGFTGKVIQMLRTVSIGLQKLFKIDRLKGMKVEIQKGCAYFSITEDLIREVLEKEKFIKKSLSHTICCDEVFVQTIAYNSCFRDRIYDIHNEWDGCMREFAWPSNLPGEHPGWNFSMKDLDHLLNSKRLFAMKFESPDGITVIDTIKKKRDIG